MQCEKILNTLQHLHRSNGGKLVIRLARPKVLLCRWWPIKVMTFFNSKLENGTIQSYTITCNNKLTRSCTQSIEFCHFTNLERP